MSSLARSRYRAEDHEALAVDEVELLDHLVAGVGHLVQQRRDVSRRYQTLRPSKSITATRPPGRQIA
jgi:hypothetical protein